jgi:hypothetical protein
MSVTREVQLQRIQRRAQRALRRKHIQRAAQSTKEFARFSDLELSCYLNYLDRSCSKPSMLHPADNQKRIKDKMRENKAGCVRS